MGLTVYTGGTFDIFHKGHVAFLKRCAEIGSVIVSLNTDEFIEAYKGSAPIMTFEERKSVLLACQYVSEVVANVGGADSTVAIEAVKPDVIVVGSDWARRDYYKQMMFNQDWLDERGIALMYVPYTQGISTTELKKRITSQVK